MIHDDSSRRLWPPSQEPLRIWIGWDERETVAYHTLCHSIISRASGSVQIAPLRQEALRAQGCYWRERGPTESTAFSLTRFLVPYLSGFQGTSVFLDCDILCRADLVADLWQEWSRARFRAKAEHRRDPALLCVQHDYQPSETVKFLGNPQTSYPRKNWSSVMVFDNERCKALTPEYVNHATGLQLHRFQWLEDSEIAPLPFGFNHLVGEYEYRPDVRLVHWTTGGPWFKEYEHADYADEWRAERDAAFGMPSNVAA